MPCTEPPAALRGGRGSQFFLTTHQSDTNMSDPSPDPKEYSRARAIANGELVDAGDLASEAGFSMPVALSAAAFSDCVSWSREDSRRQSIQSERSRLLAVLRIAAQAYRLATDRASRILFPVFRVPRDGHSIDLEEVTLQAIVEIEGGEPAVTIRLRHEA